MAAVIGLAMTASIALAYGSQILDRAILLNGVPVFLSSFFANSAVLVIFVPIGLILFDVLLLYLRNRGFRADALNRKLDVDITEIGGAEFISAELPEGSLTQGSWKPLDIKFRNNLEVPTPYYIECVSTGKVYPHTDHSKELQPGEEWHQQFNILSSKQSEIDIRIQITPKVGKAFKEELADDTTLNIKGSTLNPSSYSLGMAQFGGINFGVLGISIVWNDIVEFLASPFSFLQGLGADLSLLGLTAIIEGLILAIVLGIIIVIDRRTEKIEDEFLLTFAADQDAHDYEEVKRPILGKLIRFKRFLLPTFRFLVLVISVGAIGFLGFEGFLQYSDPTYQISQDKKLQILIISGVMLGVWIIALKGVEILEELGTKNLPPWLLQPGNVILDFKPKTPFRENIPNEVIIKAQNPTKNPGVRIVFEGLDNISPPLVELHASQGEIVNFKIAVTALKQENRHILALFYPFFDENGQEINFKESEPFDRQEIKFQVEPQTVLGLTKDQQDQLLKVGGIGLVVTTALTFAQQFISYDVTNLFTLIKQNIPYLAGLQDPFAYLYYYIKNKYLDAEVDI